MDKKYLNMAFDLAKKAMENDEVPVGVVIVKNGELLSSAFNNKNSDNLVTSHAEIIAIQDAENKLNNWRLDDCDMYVTLDPCPMCASAIKQARISNVYSALSNSDKNNSLILNMIFNSNDNLNKKINFKTNLDVEKSRKLLNSFFENKRN